MEMALPRKYDRVTGRILTYKNNQMCTTECSQMYNLHNPITFELGLGNVFVCMRCLTVHHCDMQTDCTIVNTHEGYVCAKTGLFYSGWMPTYADCFLEPICEPNIETVNVVVVLLSYVYSFLMENKERYAAIIDSIIKDGKFIKNVEDAVFYTFNAVFTNSTFNKIPLTTISRLFVQLIIGGHAKGTIYDSNVIRVSRRKREDSLLKKMRLEYGNALIL
uniref:Protein UL92 n=1 Tax=Human herpesvirus 6B TaxID=32604 RepID=A0A2L2QE97_HHV6H|nr:hypothetical protein [Human betaherpesvirus 6B]